MNCTSGSEVVLGLSNANTALRPSDKSDVMKGNIHIFPSSNSG